MKTINNPLFRKKEIFNKKHITGGFSGDKTTKHSATWQSDKGHYKCDHSEDNIKEVKPVQ